MLIWPLLPYGTESEAEKAWCLRPDRVRSLALNWEKIDDCADRCGPDYVGRTAK